MEPNDNIEKDKLKETAPKLFSVNKENPFEVPENYFENLSDAISGKCTRTDNEKSQHVIKGSFKKVLIPLAIAASVILVILISQRKNDNTVVVRTDQFAYFDNMGASEYLENLIDNNELDESLIVSELVNDDTIASNKKEDNTYEGIKTLNENPVIMNDTINNITITEDDIIQYLLEENESDDLLN